MKQISKYITRINIILADESQYFLSQNDMFYDTVSGAMKELNLTESDVADTLPVSAFTVQLWNQRKSAPIPVMRKPMYKFLLNKLNKKKELLS